MERQTQRLMEISKVSVFCGARLGNSDKFREDAYTLGETLANENVELIYGGGGLGLMGAVANGALDAGGDVTGIIPTVLVDKEMAYPRVKNMKIVDTMSIRKDMLIDEADAIIILPGGAGTMEEFFQVFVGGQIGHAQKPIALVNTDGYYDSLFDLFESFIENDFLERRFLDLIIKLDSIENVLDELKQFRPVAGRSREDIENGHHD